MALRLKIELIAGALLLLGTAFGAKVWLDEHDSRIKAEASVEMQKQLQQQYQQQVSYLGSQMQARDEQYARALDSMNTKFAQANDPQKIATLASQLMGLQTPIRIVTPPATPENPHPTPQAQIDLTEAPKAKEYLATCEQCKLDRAKLQADSTDRQAQAVLAQKEIDSLKKSNASLQTAIKGGTFFQRLGKATKYLIIGGAAALVATCTTGHCK